jgi:hypothetical protein
MIRFLCNQIEILVSKSDGIDKKLVLINVMKRVFSLNQQEIELIDHMIEFIYENDLIIKKSFTRFFDCFHSKKSQNLRILRHVPVVTITQQVIKYTPLYKDQLILVEV